MRRFAKYVGASSFFLFLVAIPAWAQQPPIDGTAGAVEEDPLDAYAREAIRDPQVMRTLDFLLAGADREGAIDRLEIMPSQLEELSTIDPRKYQLRAQVLMPVQRILLKGWDPWMIGPSQLLTETPVGRAIELTNAQQARIREQSQRIGHRLFLEYCRAREEALEMFDEVLTDEQRQTINQLYGYSGEGHDDFVISRLRSNNILPTLIYRYPKSKDDPRQIDYQAHRRIRDDD